MTALRTPQETTRRQAADLRHSGALEDTKFRGVEARPVSEAALLPATSVHPVAVAIPVAAFAWFVLAAWIAFAGGEILLDLAVVTFLSVMFSVCSSAEALCRGT